MLTPRRSLPAGDVPRSVRFRIILPYLVPLVPFALLGVLSISSGCGSGSGNLTVASAASSGLPASSATLEQVGRGRYIVTSNGCSDCHSQSVDDPSNLMWLAGYSASNPAGVGKFAIGPFTTYAANLTPDVATGLGGVSDRQVYNALKYGLDPHETADVTITSTTPGVGNFPTTPHYLAPPMPWPAIRHMSDSDLWSIVAYLKHGIKAVNNEVPDSTGPPDNWASSYIDDAVGPTNLPGFPANNEQFAP